MKLLDRFKNKRGEKNNNIYDELGIIKPFTILVDNQFNLFISKLIDNKYGLLKEAEKNAFDGLWNDACVDIDGFGNNIWNLKKGTFEIYNKEDVIVRFEKKSSNVIDKNGYDEGRANFVYLSNDGNLIISQSDRNKKVFLVFVSLDITDRLLKALRSAEAEALGIEFENEKENKRVGIPDTMVNSQITKRNINFQDDAEVSKSDDTKLSK